MNYDSIIFDFDDTLVDTTASKVPAIIDYCKTVHGTDVSSEQVARIWGIPFLQMMRELTCCHEVDTSRYLEISAGYPLISFPETQAIISALSRLMPLGIVTSLSRPVLLHSIAALGWDRGWFSVLVAEEDSPVHKPNPGVFEPLFETLKVAHEDRSRILYIGDSISDGKAAIGAGMSFIGIARDAKRQRLFDAEGWQWLSSLEEILQAAEEQR